MSVSGNDRIATLSTDELREEVARLQSLLVEDQLEDDDDEELQNSDECGTLSLVEDITLKYTNGDVYKVSVNTGVGFALKFGRNHTPSHAFSVRNPNSEPR